MGNNIQCVNSSNFQNSSQTPPTPAELNSIGNDLWLCTYFLFNSGDGGSGLQPDSFNYQMAMQGIQNFMNQFPSAPSDPYLAGIWEQLNTSSPLHPSLASLAKDYTTNGYTAADFSAFQSIVSDPYSVFGSFENTIEQFGTQEGGFSPNPQGISASSFDPLLNDLSTTPLNANQIIEDVNKLSTLLNLSTPPLDGCCQFLQTILNTPLDPTSTNPPASATSLASLCSQKDAEGLQNYLSNPTVLSDITTMLSQIKLMENW